MRDASVGFFSTQRNCNHEAAGVSAIPSTAAGWKRWRFFSRNDIIKSQGRQCEVNRRQLRRLSHKNHTIFSMWVGSEWNRRNNTCALLRTSIWLTDNRRQLEVTKQRTNGVECHQEHCQGKVSSKIPIREVIQTYLKHYSPWFTCFTIISGMMDIEWKMYTKNPEGRNIAMCIYH